MGGLWTGRASDPMQKIRISVSVIGRHWLHLIQHCDPIHQFLEEQKTNVSLYGYLGTSAPDPPKRWCASERA